jgi:hypothetical protein
LARLRREQRRLGAYDEKRAAPHVHEQCARNLLTSGTAQEGDGTVIFQCWNATAQHLFHQPVHDLDAGEIPPVYGAVIRLPRKGFLMDGTVRITIKEAAHARFQLTNALRSCLHERPGEFLVIKVRAPSIVSWKCCASESWGCRTAL